MTGYSIPALLVLGALATPQVAVGCDVLPTKDCLLADAERHIKSINDDANWIDASVELAVAQAASGLQERAYVNLLRAAVRASAQSEASQRGMLMAAVSQAMADNVNLQGSQDSATDIADAAVDAVRQVDSADKQADLRGKATVARAAAGLVEQAVEHALMMSQDNDSQAAYKARTLKSLAAIMARQNLDGGRGVLASIDMGITYYQSTANAELATLAVQHGDTAGALALLDTAVDIARAQEEGYFVAGALREAAMGYLKAGREDTANALFKEAVVGAKTASSAQQQARAVSRIASDLADAGRFKDAVALVPQAVALARMETMPKLKMWSFYEIAGAASASGDFVTARQLLSEIAPDVAFSGRSLLSAAQRDVAWGMARHGKIADAVAMSGQIKSLREKVQATCRIIRVMADGQMTALPRYL